MDVSSIDGDLHRFCSCYVYGFASGFLDWCRCGWSLWKWIWSSFGCSLLWKPVPLWIWTWSCLIANYFPAFPYLNLVYLNSLSKTLHPFVFQSEEEKERVMKSAPWSYSSNLLVLKQCELEIPEHCYNFSKTAFWVRIGGIPPGWRVETIYHDLGRKLGSLLLLLWKNWPLCTRLCRNPLCGITMGSQQNRTLWTLAVAPSPASGQDITVRETGPDMRIEAFMKQKSKLF